MAKGQKVVWYLCDKADSCAIQKFLCFYISVISNIYLKLGKKRFCFSSLKHGQNQSFVLLKTRSPAHLLINQSTQWQSMFVRFSTIEININTWIIIKFMWWGTRSKSTKLILILEFKVYAVDMDMHFFGLQYLILLLHCFNLYWNLILTSFSRLNTIHQIM